MNNNQRLKDISQPAYFDYLHPILPTGLEAYCPELLSRLLRPHGLVVTSGAPVSAIDRNHTRDVRQSCQRKFPPLLVSFSRRISLLPEIRLLQGDEQQTIPKQ
ncbi:hypothetical protein OUZ56_016716 [Daphnia magna]|uniref:Uncharacterized protein n=1 Tax=Daphnia magna TaxID=35525 RepID=A0ABR0ARD0_9CRUS|nr:hypothetical protein OUZ56_016716 [Daphnia magna]